MTHHPPPPYSRPARAVPEASRFGFEAQDVRKDGAQTVAGPSRALTPISGDRCGPPSACTVSHCPPSGEGGRRWTWARGSPSPPPCAVERAAWAGGEPLLGGTSTTTRTAQFAHSQHVCNMHVTSLNLNCTRKTSYKPYIAKRPLRPIPWPWVILAPLASPARVVRRAYSAGGPHPVYIF